MNTFEATDAELAAIKNILSALTGLNGVNTAVCVGRDGFEIDSSGFVNTDINTIGAMVSPGLGAAECVGKMLTVGTLSLAIVECTRGFVVMTSVGSDFILVVAAEKNSNLKSVLSHVKQQKKELETIL